MAQDDLLRIELSLKLAAVAFQKHSTLKDFVKVSFPEDRIKDRSGTAIISIVAKVSGYFNEKIETEKDQLAIKIRNILFEDIRNVSIATCFIYLTDEKFCFSSASSISTI